MLGIGKCEIIAYLMHDSLMSVILLVLFEVIGKLLRFLGDHKNIEFLRTIDIKVKTWRCRIMIFHYKSENILTSGQLLYHF